MSISIKLQRGARLHLASVILTMFDTIEEELFM